MKWINYKSEPAKTAEQTYRRIDSKNLLDSNLIYDFLPSGILYGTDVIPYENIEYLDETPSPGYDVKEMISKWENRLKDVLAGKFTPSKSQLISDAIDDIKEVSESLHLREDKAEGWVRVEEIDTFLRNYPEYRCLDMIGKFKNWKANGK